MRLTDEDVEVINTLIKKCKFRVAFDICGFGCLPCSKVIDNGNCPEICDYIRGKADD